MKKEFLDLLNEEAKKNNVTFALLKKIGLKPIDFYNVDDVDAYHFELKEKYPKAFFLRMSYNDFGVGKTTQTIDLKNGGTSVITEAIWADKIYFDYLKLEQSDASIEHQKMMIEVYKDELKLLLKKRKRIYDRIEAVV